MHFASEKKLKVYTTKPNFCLFFGLFLVGGLADLISSKGGVNGCTKRGKLNTKVSYI